jgi:hypothetical protein
MSIPFTYYDISLWLAITSIILLATSELLSPNYGQTRLIIEKKHLKITAIILGVLFLSTVAIRIFEIIITL